MIFEIGNLAPTVTDSVVFTRQARMALPNAALSGKSSSSVSLPLKFIGQPSAETQEISTVGNLCIEFIPWSSPSSQMAWWCDIVMSEGKAGRFWVIITSQFGIQCFSSLHHLDKPQSLCHPEDIASVEQNGPELSVNLLGHDKVWMKFEDDAEARNWYDTVNVVAESAGTF